MTTTQKVLATIALTTALGAGIYQTVQASRFRSQADGLQRQQEPIGQLLRLAQQQRDAATAEVARLRDENEELRRNAAELPKLRGEVGRLRENGSELARLKAGSDASGNDPGLEAAFKTWAERATRLRQRLDQNSAQRIPELQLLNEKGWFDAVKTLKNLESEDDFAEAFSNARNLAKAEFGAQVRQALRGYLAASEGVLPQDLSQLKPYFSQPVDDAVLARYRLLQSGKLSDVAAAKEQYLVGENAPLIDEDRDATYQFGLNGTHSHTGSPVEDAVKDAGTKFAAANNGLLPTEPSQLAPYLKQPLDPDKIQKILNKVPPGVTTLEQLKALSR